MLLAVWRKGGCEIERGEFCAGRNCLRLLPFSAESEVLSASRSTGKVNVDNVDGEKEKMMGVEGHDERHIM